MKRMNAAACMWQAARLPLACIAHRARLKNILRSSGFDPIEKALLQQRFANLAAAQGGYVEKQKKALAGNGIGAGVKRSIAKI